MSTPTDVMYIQSDWHPEVANEMTTSHQWVEQTSVWVNEWGDDLPRYITYFEARNKLKHGLMHRRFHKEGCR